MKQILLGMVLVIGLVGCDMPPPHETVDTNTTRCLDGVVYHVFTESSGYHGYGFMSPKYNQDGTLVLCNGAGNESCR